MMSPEKLKSLAMNPTIENFKKLVTEVERNMAEIRRRKSEVSDVCSIVDKRNARITELEQQVRSLTAANEGLSEKLEDTQTVLVNAQESLQRVRQMNEELTHRLKEEKPELSGPIKEYLSRVIFRSKKREEGSCRSKTHNDLIFILEVLDYLTGKGFRSAREDKPWPTITPIVSRGLAIVHTYTDRGKASNSD